MRKRAICPFSFPYRFEIILFKSRHRPFQEHGLKYGKREVQLPISCRDEVVSLPFALEDEFIENVRRTLDGLVSQTDVGHANAVGPIVIRCV